jgi:DMSO/TMAO reductase YedYZ molybdopterin-dependent catalytic subunit
MRRLTRRRLLAVAAAAPALAQSGTLIVPGKKPMIVHNDFPEDLESLPEYLSTWITPNDRFFVRQHLPRPKVEAGAWRVDIGGMVASRLSLAIADLRKMPQVSLPATLECAGNGRGGFQPKIPGLQWTKGAIGNAQWRGPRLRDLLAKAGGSAQAAFVDFDGADVPLGKVPEFTRSIPMRKAMLDSTILALEMNGQPLPELHGGPLRIIVPGWDGASWVKWVNSIQVQAQSNPGFYMARAYKYPRVPGAPGSAVKPEDMEALEGMAVKSFFAAPAPDSKAKAGTPVTFQGIGWGGENRIVRVEVSTDGGSSWRPAALGKEDFPFAWRTFSFAWTPGKPGYHTVCCRATDSAGRSQPIDAAWNPSGYLNNSIERLGILVEG